MESQVFEDEVRAGATRAVDPPEEMPEQHNHGKISQKDCHDRVDRRDATIGRNCVSGAKEVSYKSDRKSEIRSGRDVVL
jgi:hypothetical protein